MVLLSQKTEALSPSRKDYRLFSLSPSQTECQSSLFLSQRARSLLLARPQITLSLFLSQTRRWSSLSLSVSDSLSSLLDRSKALCLRAQSALTFSFREIIFLSLRRRVRTHSLLVSERTLCLSRQEVTIIISLYQQRERELSFFERVSERERERFSFAHSKRETSISFSLSHTKTELSRCLKELNAFSFPPLIEKPLCRSQTESQSSLTQRERERSLFLKEKGREISHSVS